MKSAFDITYIMTDGSKHTLTFSAEDWTHIMKVVFLAFGKEFTAATSQVMAEVRIARVVPDKN